MCTCEGMDSQKPLNVTSIHRLNISVVLSSQLPSNSGNHRDIPDSSPDMYPTRILSHNHCHRTCIGEDMGTYNRYISRLYTQTQHCSGFSEINFRQTPAIREISWTHVHTGPSHVFSHTTTVIACVLLKTWVVKNRQMSR